ncbi:unnamed protein product [Clavelina lepadiformis]|uniref:Uncharacterized protein n=1 Tax=Clavelina lepadiformis TaxID=159417 RepID=A0ABP0FUJ2_CLALP
MRIIKVFDPGKKILDTLLVRLTKDYHDLSGEDEKERETNRAKISPPTPPSSNCRMTYTVSSEPVKG